LEHYVGAAANVLAPSWFTCIGLAGLAALVLMVVIGKRRGVEPATIATILLWGYVAAVAAGITMPMLIDAVERGSLSLRWAGMTSFWGYMAAFGVVLYMCRREKVSLATLGDIAVIPIGAATVFARIGCFLGGCDYGKVTSAPWAVRFPQGSPAWRDHVHSGLIPADRVTSLPVHPTQLYEALIGVAIILFGIVFARRVRTPGRMFLIGAAIYATGRLLVVEPLRGDAGRGIYAGLSSGQIFSLLMLASIAICFVMARRAAMVVAAASALVLVVYEPGEALAQPIFGPQPAPSQPAPSQPAIAPGDTQPQPRPGIDVPPNIDPEHIPFEQQPPPPLVLGPHERPLFSTGVLVGVATPFSRKEIGSLTGSSVSLGYLPGRFGLWMDLDLYSNNEAAHSSVLAAASFSQRVTRDFTLGVRTGLGLGLVNFKDPAFSDVAAKTFRLEFIAEYAFVRNWAMWVRPIAIDTISAPELGGAITTYQFRVGAAYRFGSRRNAPRPGSSFPPPPPPTFAAQPSPSTPPVFVSQPPPPGQPALPVGFP
jgi:phosphatidylglycerol:prolipoprotein diacylglycerol transferase